jgi:hypothetical protein
MLRGDRPAPVGIAAVGFVDITQAELQLTARIGLETGDVEVVPIDVVLLVQVVLARELTKKFEEYLRGTPGELTAIKAKRSLKGEFVVLISPSSADVSTEAENNTSS